MRDVCLFYSGGSFFKPILYLYRSSGGSRFSLKSEIYYKIIRNCILRNVNPDLVGFRPQGLLLSPSCDRRINR